MAINFMTKSNARLLLGSAGEGTAAVVVDFRRFAMDLCVVDSFAVDVLVSETVALILTYK